jgi:GT2 family glycosyltransferase
VASAPRENPAPVSVVVVTYDPNPEMLGECLDSLARSAAVPQEVVVVDNSRQHDVVEKLVELKLPSALGPIFLPQASNLGYAAATNAGVAASSAELVLLLNPDAALEPAALGELCEAASAQPDTLGFAPKIKLSDPGVVIDSVGMAIGRDGVGVQRGLGQADLGQYDRPERVAGVCFAAALVRREAFAPQSVGALDERYFMYYEDVDWSMRAAIMGEEFRTVPQAVVRHLHSGSTRSLGQGFKHRLIQRNLIWTAVKNLEVEGALKVLVRRSSANLKWAAAGRHPAAALRAVAEVWLGLPGVMLSRREVQRRRHRRDREALGLEEAQVFFDGDTYRPDVSAAALVAAVGRLYALAPTPKLESALLRLRSAEATGLGRDRALLAEMLDGAGLPDGPALSWLKAELSS